MQGVTNNRARPPYDGGMPPDLAMAMGNPMMGAGGPMGAMGGGFGESIGTEQAMINKVIEDSLKS